MGRWRRGRWKRRGKKGKRTIEQYNKEHGESKV